MENWRRAKILRTHTFINNPSKSSSFFRKEKQHAPAIRLILEDWVLGKGNFRRACGGEDCLVTDCLCPWAYFSPESDEAASFTDFLEFLSKFRYSGESISAMSIGSSEVPKVNYQLYFVPRGDGFHERASAILKEVWCVPRKLERTRTS